LQGKANAVDCWAIPVDKGRDDSGLGICRSRWVVLLRSRGLLIRFLPLLLDALIDPFGDLDKEWNDRGSDGIFAMVNSLFVSSHCS
jgi:hypothetical protein